MTIDMRIVSREKKEKSQKKRERKKIKEKVIKWMFKKKINAIISECIRGDACCENCRFRVYNKGCAFGNIPKKWNENEITERMFKK